VIDWGYFRRLFVGYQADLRPCDWYEVKGVVDLLANVEFLHTSLSRWAQAWRS